MASIKGTPFAAPIGGIEQTHKDYATVAIRGLIKGSMGGIMYCVQCRATNPAGSSFCRNFGASPFHGSNNSEIQSKGASAGPETALGISAAAGTTVKA